MEIELGIHLGLNCNFRCAHCLNDSKPGRTDFDITPTQIDQLLNEIETNLNVTAVSYSGGEPLLYLDQIEFIQSYLNKLGRKFHFAMTTNGSLLSRFESKLALLGLSEILISYDKSHNPFIDVESIKKAILAAKRIAASVKLVLTYTNNPLELDLSELALDLEIEVYFNQAVSSGRFRAGTRSIAVRKSVPCPNFPSETRKRLKIVYLPKQGFSHCCGPLLFDRLEVETKISFNSINDAINSDQFKIQTFFSKFKLKRNDKSDCDNCVLLAGFVYNSDLLRKLILSEPQGRLLTKTQIGKEPLGVFENFFRIRNVGYFYGERTSPVAGNPPCNPNLKMVVVDVVDKKLGEDFFSFAVNTFYAVHKDHYSAADIAEFEKQIPLAFAYPTVCVRHYYHGNLVGFFILFNLPEDKIINSRIWHIGYWGISSQIKDRFIREEIKISWLNMLNNSAREHPVRVFIDNFNLPALTMAKNFGFKFDHIRFDNLELE